MMSLRLTDPETKELIGFLDVPAWVIPHPEKPGHTIYAIESDAAFSFRPAPAEVKQ